MSAFEDAASIPPQQVWDGNPRPAGARGASDDAVVEPEPGAVAAEHRHDHEQLGIVLRGSIRFRVGGEERDLGPGGTWRIASETAHVAVAGPDGATVIDVFALSRDEWRELEQHDRGRVAGPRTLFDSTGATRRRSRRRDRCSRSAGA